MRGTISSSYKILVIGNSSKVPSLIAVSPICRSWASSPGSRKIIWHFYTINGSAWNNLQSYYIDHNRWSVSQRPAQCQELKGIREGSG